MKNTTIILYCGCHHEAQDEMYGKGRRVHNVNDKGEAYCTVCTPRNLSCERHGSDIDANKVIGNSFIPARKPRKPKNVLNL